MGPRLTANERLSYVHRTPPPLKTHTTISSGSASILVAKARQDSDQLLHSPPWAIDLDRIILPFLLQLLTCNDEHRICLRNWNSFQITQLDHAVHHTDTVPVLNESLTALRTC